MVTGLLAGRLCQGSKPACKETRNHDVRHANGHWLNSGTAVGLRNGLINDNVSRPPEINKIHVEKGLKAESTGGKALPTCYTV
jgi:hypothetical protein